MKGKDTVMSDRELLHFELKYTRGDNFYWGAAFDAALKAQAAISFKAGIKEVVDYVSTHRDENSYDEYWGFYVIDPEDWIERLKEWGVEDAGTN